MWPIIGARMRFVGFPGTNTQPARSGPGVSPQLQRTYTEYPAEFDKVYVHSILQKNGFSLSRLSDNAAGSSQENNPAAGSPQIKLYPSRHARQEWSSRENHARDRPSQHSASLAFLCLDYADTPEDEYSNGICQHTFSALCLIIQGIFLQNNQIAHYAQEIVVTLSPTSTYSESKSAAESIAELT